MRPNPTHLHPPSGGTLTFALLLGAALAGCLGGSSDRPHAPLPMEVQNGATGPVQVTLSIREPYGRSVLSSHDYDLPPGGYARFETIELEYGTYTLRAETSQLTREADVDFGGSVPYYEFVVYDDVIAFRQGGPSLAEAQGVSP